MERKSHLRILALAGSLALGLLLAGCADNEESTGTDDTTTGTGAMTCPEQTGGATGGASGTGGVGTTTGAVSGADTTTGGDCPGGTTTTTGADGTMTGGADTTTTGSY